MTGTVPVDRWDLIHLLLSIDDRARSERDARALSEVVNRTVAALDALAPASTIEVPSDVSKPLLVEGHPGWIMETNSWLLVHGSECVVVDVPPNPQRLLRRMAELEVTPVAVALTHGHVDHVGGVAELLRAIGTRVPVLVSTPDLRPVRRPRTGGVLSAQVAGVWPVPADAIERPRPIELGPVIIRPLGSPGHTPGSTCLLVEGTARWLLVTGDTLFGRGTGRNDLPEGRPRVAARSLRRLLALLDDDVLILPGHGAPATLGEARRWLGGARPTAPPAMAAPSAVSLEPSRGS